MSIPLSCLEKTREWRHRNSLSLCLAGIRNSAQSRTVPPMKLPRKAWVLCSGIVIALVLWGIWTSRPGEVATRRLADGSVLTLKAATYEKRHRFRTGDRWLDYLGSSLPELLAKKLDCR